MGEDKHISEFIGQKITKISGGNKGDDEIVISFEAMPDIKILHFQDCCEDVQIEDIDANLQDFVGGQLLGIEKSNGELPALDEYDDSYTWSFVKIKTTKGWANVRFYGTSNGYYSEDVDVCWDDGGTYFSPDVKGVDV